MSNFTPTHEFRGLKLEYASDNPYMHYHSYYRTEDGHRISLPVHLITKLSEKPKPGEVWIRRDGDPMAGVSPLRYVNTEGDLTYLSDLSDSPNQFNFANRGDGPTLHSSYKKLLNADGTPA